MMEHSLAKVIFRLIKPSKLIRNWFPKRSTNFYSVLLSENSPVAITIFCIVCFEAVARVLYDVSNNVRTPQELDFRLITTSKNDFSEIHTSSGQRPKFVVPLFSLDTSKPHWVHLMQAMMNWKALGREREKVFALSISWPLLMVPIFASALVKQ